MKTVPNLLFTSRWRSSSCDHNIILMCINCNEWWLTLKDMNIKICYNTFCVFCRHSFITQCTQRGLWMKKQDDATVLVVTVCDIRNLGIKSTFLYANVRSYTFLRLFHVFITFSCTFFFWKKMSKKLSVTTINPSWLILTPTTKSYVVSYALLWW